MGVKTNPKVLAAAKKVAQIRAGVSKMKELAKAAALAAKTNQKNLTPKELDQKQRERFEFASSAYKAAPGGENLKDDPVAVAKRMAKGGTNVGVSDATSAQTLGVVFDAEKATQKMNAASGRVTKQAKISKQAQEETKRVLATSVIADAVESCREYSEDIATVPACIAEKKRIAVYVRGDSKNVEKDLKNANTGYAFNEVVKCSAEKLKTADTDAKKQAARKICQKEYAATMKITTGAPPTDPAKELELTTCKEGSKLMRNRANMGVLTREEEKTYRDGVKKVFELGVDSREVELKMKKSTELNASNAGADAKLAGLSDDEASELMENSMNSDPDADDYTPSKKKEMMQAVRGVVAGGKTGQLKFQKEPKIELRICLTSATNTITVADIKKVVSDSATAAALVLLKLAVTTEVPKKDDITQRTCGTVVIPVKDEKLMASVKNVFAALTFLERRGLGGRNLNTDETTVSSGRSQVIVTVILLKCATFFIALLNPA